MGTLFVTVIKILVFLFAVAYLALHPFRFVMNVFKSLQRRNRLFSDFCKTRKNTRRFRIVSSKKLRFTRMQVLKMLVKLAEERRPIDAIHYCLFERLAQFGTLPRSTAIELKFEFHGVGEKGLKEIEEILSYFVKPATVLKNEKASSP